MKHSFDDAVDKAMKVHLEALLRAQNVACSSTDNGVCVPQRPYNNGTGRGNPRDRGLEFFFREDGSYLPVKEALDKKYQGHGLMGQSSPAVVGADPTLTVRFEWPGYPSKEYQLRTIDWCDPPKKIVLRKLAIEVAKFVQKFVGDMQGKPIDANYASWRVGQDFIRVEDLRLGAFEQVTHGSWQVRLFYKRSH